MIKGTGLLEEIRQLINNHDRFLQYNTGTTNDATQDFYVLNPQGVLSNNRHFINFTRQEYQPNGDATTEGQSLHILGYIYSYLATQKIQYLHQAEWYCEAYFKYFYAGQPIPETPQRWACNWIINGKEPVLANYPLGLPNEPTTGGFKNVTLSFTNGLAYLPKEAPYWGQYLDMVAKAFPANGIVGWESVNASILPMNQEGNPDWSQPYMEEIPIDWIVTWSQEKITADGDVIETNVNESEIGSIQLLDTDFTGSLKINYATKQPTEHGGTFVLRNEPQHNRPLHVPLRGDVNQMSNAADAEVWMVDVTYLLWKLTGKEKYKKALDSILFSANEYLDIDRDLWFFKEEVGATTPFTVGTSYDFTYPSGVDVTYSRDGLGYIIGELPVSCDLSMEQQSIKYRLSNESSCLVKWAGVGNSGEPVPAEVQLTLSPDKTLTTQRRYIYKTQPSSDLDIKNLEIPMTKFTASSDVFGNPYMLARKSNTVDINGSTYQEVFESNVIDGRDIVSIACELPNENSQIIIGFWSMPDEILDLQSITYKSSDVVWLITMDLNGWRWGKQLPASEDWVTVDISDYESYVFMETQPNREGRPDPESIAYTPPEQILITTAVFTQPIEFSYYCMNTLPELFNEVDAWSKNFRITFNCSEAYSIKLGDCKILKHRLDGLMYTPGLLPFSNIYQVGTSEFAAWRGLPYPGYQFPMVHTLGFMEDDPVKLENIVNFLWDSQQYYFNRFGQLGPDAYAFIWDRPDATQYGPPNTFTMDQWVEGRAWAGYQPRGFCWAARTWQNLFFNKQPVPEKLKEYCTNWCTWLIWYMEQSNANYGYDWLPYVIPTNRIVDAGEGSFNGHMAGLYLAGMSFVASTGVSIPGLEKTMSKITKHLKERMIIMDDRPHHPMQGAWTSWHSPSTDGGMFYGFWAGEILRGLSSYLLYKTHGSKDWYKQIPNTVYTEPKFPFVAKVRPRRESEL